MVICPSCGSSRIRSGYKPAPFYLRIFGIRGLLCDNCNFPFHAFSPLPPKSRRPHQHKQKADVVISAPTVELSKIKQEPVAEKPKLELVLPAQEKLSFAASASPSLPKARIVTQHLQPIRTDLRTEVTKIHASGTVQKLPPKNTSPKQAAQAVETSSSQACPECNSRNVKRRHRNFVERAFLFFSEHKAYTCRNCGSSFYARSEKHQSHPSAVG